MKQPSNFLKKILQLLLVLVIGFTGGILGTLTSFQFTKGNSTNPSQEIKSTKVNHAYKNTTSTSEAVDKVKNAVVSVSPLMKPLKKASSMEKQILIQK